MKFSVPKWQWRPLTLPDSMVAYYASVRLGEVLDSWEGTPYMPGQQLKQVGVDCVRLVCRIFDELHRLEETPLAQVPPDASMHSREGAIATMRKIVRAYAPLAQVQDGSIEPGDVVVVGPVGGGPGHAMIATTRKNVLLHADQDAVTLAGLGFALTYQKIFGVFRKGDREEWARV